MKEKLPISVKKIISTLNKGGFSCVLVGGCVRDYLMNRQINDYDLATDALPNQVEEIFNSQGYKTIDIGKKHGTIVVRQASKSFEITTYRWEGRYRNHRFPSEVKFVKDIYEDLKRRDFTMNAIAYDIHKGFIDPFNGQLSINKKNIKAVGDPNKRFTEDALRILRGMRFKSQLSFDIELETLKAMRSCKGFLNEISIERIREEFNKILLSDQPSETLRLMKNIELLEVIIPELKLMYGFNQHNPNHHLTVFEHTLKVVDGVSKDLVLRLAALLHDIGKPDAFFLDNDGIGHFYNHEKKSVEISMRILERLKYPKTIQDKVLDLIKEHMVVYNQDFSDKAVKKLMNRLETCGFDRFLELQYADINATANPDKNTHLTALKKRVGNIKNKKEPRKICDLAINGHDLINLGIPQGKKIGNLLKELMDLVLDKPELNQKDLLMNYIQDKKSNHD